jgi:hypothetical protein
VEDKTATELANGIVRLLTDDQVRAIFAKHKATANSTDTMRSIMVNELWEFIVYGDESSVFCWWV